MATHLGSKFQIGDSQFFVKTSQSPDYPVSVYTPNNDLIAPEPWFVINGNPTITCASNCPPPEPWSNDPQTATAYATGVFANDPFGEVLTWEGQLNLFSRLKQAPNQMTGNTTMATFYNASETGMIGAFETVAQAVRGLNAPPAEVVAEWEQALAQITQARNAIENKKGALINALTETDSTTLFRAIDSIQQVALPAVGQILELQHNFRVLRQQRALAALSMANQLPENTLWQRNRKSVDRLYLETVGMGVDSLNTQQFSEVSAIAHQCPLEGGSAVYRARGLYRMREHKIFSDDLLCASAMERGQAREVPKAVTGLAIRPNPATEMLFVEVPGKGRGMLEFFDLHGKRFQFVAFNEDQQFFNIEVKTWPAGIYFCRASGEQGMPEPIKIIIQH